MKFLKNTALGKIKVSFILDKLWGNNYSGQVVYQALFLRSLGKEEYSCFYYCYSDKEAFLEIIFRRLDFKLIVWIKRIQLIRPVF